MSQALCKAALWTLRSHHLGRSATLPITVEWAKFGGTLLCGSIPSKYWKTAWSPASLLSQFTYMQEVQTHITNFQVLRPVSLAVPVQKEILLQALAISLKMERENSALIEPAELPPPSDW